MSQKVPSRKRTRLAKGVAFDEMQANLKSPKCKEVRIEKQKPKASRRIVFSEENAQVNNNATLKI